MIHKERWSLIKSNQRSFLLDMSRGSLCKKITMFCNISTHEVIFCLLAWTFEHFLSMLPTMRSTWFSRFFFLLFCFVLYSKTQALNRTLDQVKAWIESCWVLFFSVLLMKGSTQKIITGRIIKKTHTKKPFLVVKIWVAIFELDY